MKCPACGFDSGALWCDFCKEPFNKKPSAGPAGRKKPQLGPEALKLTAEELALLDDSGRIPALPGWLRYAAWSLLAISLMWALGMSWLVYGRYKASREQAQAPSQ